MLSKIFIAISLFVSSFAFSLAQSNTSPDKFLCLTCAKGLIDNVNQYIVVAIGTLLLAVSVVGFFLGVVRFIWAQQNGNEKGVASGKQTLLWGLIALFCAFSVYGIISFGQSIFFKDARSATNIVIPKFIIDTPPTGDGSFPTGSAGAGGRLPTGTSPGNFPTGSTPRPGYSPSPSGPGGTVYTAPGANTSGGRGSTGPCYKDGEPGSYVNGKCITESASNQEYARNLFNDCFQKGGTLLACQIVYTNNGGSGNGFMNYCIGNGGSSNSCSASYSTIINAQNSGGSAPAEEPGTTDYYPEQDPCDSAGC
jgi:hypothetical protein